MEQKHQVPLAQIMKDSLKSKKVITNFVPLPTLPEPPGSESTSYSLPLSHCQSLNNVRVLEHNSSPKNQRHLSKSDLSLHRSEIFLENLCESEVVVEADFKRKSVEKTENDLKIIQNLEDTMIQASPNNVLCVPADIYSDIAHNDSVSYELPNDEVNLDNSAPADKNMGLNAIDPPSSNNQSTPKKQSFVTKDEAITKDLNTCAKSEENNGLLYNSCPNTPYKQSGLRMIYKRNPTRSLSMNEVSDYDSTNKLDIKPLNTLERYNSFKNVLQSSFRKSKTFIKKKGKLLSTSLNFSTKNAKVSPVKLLCTDSKPNLEDLLSLNESACINQQIARTVSICRKLPDLETSMEMVEAERLLLFSALRRENQLALSSMKNHTMSQKPNMRFFVDDIYLPVISDVNRDIYFNYFYIITFECDGVIKSTQSSECVNGTAIFRDNGIEFAHSSELGETKENAINCNIFMLRLRKLSTVSMEWQENAIIDSLAQNPSATLKSTSSSSTSSSTNEVVSRFRLNASFTLNAKDFVPFEYVRQESVNSDRICIRASCLCILPLIARSKLTNLPGQLQLRGRAEVRVPKHAFDGFLNVEYPQNQHNWNRRWCTLDGIFLYVWQDRDSLNTSPILAIDLRDSKHNINEPLICSPRELCARPRSFCLKYNTDKSCKDMSTSSVFFAADTQQNLDDWLKNLNIVLEFIATWL